MLPRGSSACVSWIRTFWKSTNLDLLTSSMKRARLLQTGFRQIVGCVYWNRTNHRDLEAAEIRNLSETLLNSLAPGKFEWNFGHVIFKQILVIDGWGISCEIALIWMPLDLTDDKSTLVQVMAWCRQATSHYLSQCWPSSLSPYGVIRPQWFNSLAPRGCSCNVKFSNSYPGLTSWTFLVKMPCSECYKMPLIVSQYWFR